MRAPCKPTATPIPTNMHARLLVHSAITHRSTAAWKKASTGTASASRICFFYSVGMSWDPRRDAKGQSESEATAKTRHRPVVLWREDFALFMDTMSQLVTAESENYIAVFPGRTKRQGAGLSVEAGLFTETQIIELVRVSGKAWRTKRATIVYKNATADRIRGIHGVLQEAALLFYRGAWASRIMPVPRVHCEGSTWDDVWMNATPCTLEDLPRVPYAVKVAVLRDTAWSSMLKAAKEEEDSAPTAPHHTPRHPESTLTGHAQQQ